MHETTPTVDSAIVETGSTRKTDRINSAASSSYTVNRQGSHEYPSAVAANRVSAVIELNPSATDRTNRAMPYSVRAMTTLMPSRNPVPVITGKIISKGSDGMANN